MGISLRRPSRSSAIIKVLTCWLLCSALLWLGAVQAQTTSYVHDANRRVVAVTQSNGTTVQYGYDALGHVGPVSAPLSAGQLAMFAFMPTHGVAGAQVTIEGQGFSSTLANNNVTFNGTKATVLSASTTELVVTVPSGATTGSIAVTVGGQTASSSVPFVVDDTGVPPTISGVTPALIAAGGTISVTGMHLDPVPGDTTLQIGGADMSLSSVTDTQLQFTASTSGYVTVQTPYGQTTSTTSVLVVPSAVGVSSVVSTATTSVGGAPVTLNMASSGQVGIVSFNATLGSWLSLQASGIAPSSTNISYTIYAPGNVAIEQGTISTGAPSIHLPTLTASGTYLAVFQSSASGTQLTVSLNANASITPGVAATVTTNVSGQSQRILFQASAGQTLAFAVNSTTTSPANTGVSYTIYTPGGGGYTQFTTSTTGLVNLTDLPENGTYQVVIAPESGATGTMQVELASGVTGALSPTGTSQSYSANVPSQSVYLTFTATAGQDLELAVTHYSSTMSVYVLNAAGTQVGGSNCYTTYPGDSCLSPLWNLAAGTYTVEVVPSTGSTASFNIQLQPDVIGPALTANTPTAVTLGAGQTERLTFNGTAGSTIALDLSQVATTPPGQGVTVQVYAPGTSPITTSTGSYTSFTTVSSETVNLTNLPASGTYTVIVSSLYGLPSSAQLEVASGVTGTLSAAGASQSYSAAVPSQNVYLTLTATAGENLELTVTHYSSTMSVYVLNAAGTQVGGSNCYNTNPGDSCLSPLWNLAAGTYTVEVVPSTGTIASFNIQLQPDVIGPALTANTPTAVTLGAGQTERLTFNGTAGSTVALYLAQVATTPSGQGVTVQVYAPGTSPITTSTGTYTSFTTTSSETVNLTNLPAGGTYTVIVSSLYGLPSSAQLEVASGVTGTLSATSASQSYSAAVPSQNVYLTFTATAGENLELTITQYSSSFSVYVLNAAGTQIGGSNCYNTYPGDSCLSPLWNLAAGTYTVEVVPSTGSTASFNIQLQPDVIGPALTANAPTAATLGAGQTERLTFNGTAGSTIALYLSQVATTPSGQGITVQMYAPSSSSITTSTGAYTSFTTSSSETVNLTNLPASGTYTVIVSSPYGLASSAQLEVASGVTGTLSPSSTSQSYTTPVPNQYVYLTFTVTAGENLELTATNYSSFLAVYVLNSSGTQIGGGNCYPTYPADSCNSPLWNLPAGTYTVKVVPGTGDTASFTVQMQSDEVGPTLTANTPTSVALGAGQAEWLTFTGTEGSAVALELSSVATTPTGQPVYVNVYSPTTTSISTNNYYQQFNTTSSSTLNLSSLPASGTYTLVVYTTYGVPANAQLTLVPQ